MKEQDRKRIRDVDAGDEPDPIAKEVQEEFDAAQQLVPEDNPLIRKLSEHTSKTPELSAGDLDAAWDRADSGEETVGGSSPTPDQDVVDELGQAVGIPYQDQEPLHTTDKLEQRDRERWELDPASSEDYDERKNRPSHSS